MSPGLTGRRGLTSSLLGDHLRGTRKGKDFTFVALSEYKNKITIAIELLVKLKIDGY